jgi:hypothetical protein
MLTFINSIDEKERKDWDKMCIVYFDHSKRKGVSLYGLYLDGDISFSGVMNNDDDGEEKLVDLFF